jgi:signal transduction histidine kinase/ActR/RegA family two-component response regulator
MTFAASIALMSAGIACYVATLSAQFSRAPGWRDQRYFSLAALAAAAYAALNVPSSAPVLSDHGAVVCSRIQIGLAALHAFAWLRYSSVFVGRPGSRVDRALSVVLALAAIAALVPHAFLTGEIRRDYYAPLGIVYRTSVTTPAGDVAYTAILGTVLVPVVRFFRAWRRGVPNTAAQFLALAFLLLLGVHDLLVVSDVYEAPYLLDVAFLLPVGVVGYVLTSRFVEDSRAHEALRSDLQHQVEERTAELSRAQEKLHRTEKLAALGQFAAGVAHEVNNPAAVVNANLAYLDESEKDALSPEGREAVSESIQSVQRIGAIVRQLLDAGRLAASPEARSSVPLRRLAESASSVARARFGKRVRVTNHVPEDLHASGDEGILAQVLANLVANAVQAIQPHRSDGHVQIRAEEDGERVRLHVDDNGSGMEPEVLRRVFEPFFTTKPFGSGTGLGLAVSRGLVMSLAGDLRLESTPGEGTRATIELACADTPRRSDVRALPSAARGPRQRLLIVDDETSVLKSLRRLLEPRYGVELASGVDDALERIQEQEFDLVLCDVMMPAGGGERLYSTLLGRSPAAARRVVFFTGGAVTDAARQFLKTQPQPILYKPFDPEQLARAAENVTGYAGSRGLTRSH